jgi:hypothetical protein
MGISLKDLMYDTLRMRPDRMVVGEVRNKTEFEALFDVLLAGQARGSYATLHSQGAMEAVQRMKSFGIDEMDIESIDCIVIQRRMLVYDAKRRKNTEVRKMTEIAEIDHGLRTLFSFDRKNNRLKATGKGRLLSRIASDFNMSYREIQHELDMRTRLLSSLSNDFMEFFNSFQERMYGVKSFRISGSGSKGVDIVSKKTG